MGIFSKKECALCGAKAGLLTRLHLKDDVFICGDCGQKTSANMEGYGDYTLDEVKENMSYKEENDQRYESEFTHSREIVLDNSHPIMAVDDTKGEFALLKDNHPDIFSFDDVLSYNVDLNTSSLSEEEKKKSSSLSGILDFLFSDDFGSRYPDLPRCPYGCKVIGMYFEIRFRDNPHHAKKIRLDMIPGWSNTKQEIENGYWCANELFQCFKEYKNGSRTAAAAPAAPSAGDAADQIKKLKELLDMGALTQEEFDAKKKELLGL